MSDFKEVTGHQSKYVAGLESCVAKLESCRPTPILTKRLSADEQNEICVDLRKKHNTFAEALRSVKSDELATRWMNNQMRIADLEYEQIPCSGIPIAAQPLQRREDNRDCDQLRPDVTAAIANPHRSSPETCPEWALQIEYLIKKTEGLACEADQYPAIHVERGQLNNISDSKPLQARGTDFDAPNAAAHNA